MESEGKDHTESMSEHRDRSIFPVERNNRKPSFSAPFMILTGEIRDEDEEENEDEEKERVTLSFEEVERAFNKMKER